MIIMIICSLCLLKIEYFVFPDFILNLHVSSISASSFLCLCVSLVSLFAHGRTHRYLMHNFQSF